MKIIIILLLLSLTGCSGMYVSNNMMAMGTIGRNQINMCKEIPPEPVPVGKEFEIDGPPKATKVCIDLGNKNQPQGTIAKLFSLIIELAPYVALAFGLPIL